MRRGVWHQCGDRSQKLAAEQLQRGVGVGVVISPRDLAYNGAMDYAKQYHDLGTAVLTERLAVEQWATLRPAARERCQADVDSGEDLGGGGPADVRIGNGHDCDTPCPGPGTGGALEVAWARRSGSAL
jgi:hypothetical protein